MVLRFLNIFFYFRFLSGIAGICFANNSQIPQENCSQGFNSNTTTIYFGNYRILMVKIFFILKENENIHVSAPRGIKFIFAKCQKVLATACEIPKIRENLSVLLAVLHYPLPIILLRLYPLQ
jgi:hypothetical protein